MDDTKELNEKLARLVTEQSNRNLLDIDRMGVTEILKSINGEDKLVAVAVEREIPHIAAAVELVVDALRERGRLVYVGAGTSGRLGILDAAECPPTFGTPPEKIIGIIAGGRDAVFKSQEGAEDDVDQADRDMRSINLQETDVVCGIAASSRTPYVVRSLDYAKSVGAKTIFITTNPRSSAHSSSDVAICPEVGPEVIMGSTRMKSGTAQKMVLNMITSAAMIRLGKVYKNMMVDLQLTNQKLVERAKRIIMLATGVDYERAAAVLHESGGHVKTSIVMIRKNVGRDAARALLERAGGFVAPAVD